MNSGRGKDFNLKAEILKNKYSQRRIGVSDPEFKAGGYERPGNHSKQILIDAAESRMDGGRRSPRFREIRNYDKALKELFEVVSSRPQRLDSACSASESEEELSETNILCTETDVTLPSDVAFSSSSCASDLLWLDREKMRDQTEALIRSPTPISQVYREMVQIYEKLQAERLSQQAWAAKLLEREQQLQQRENLLLHQQNTIHRLEGVEGEVLSRITDLQQQHQQEMEKLRNALKEKIKENKRIKSSFDSIKELNDTMKKQLNEVGEQNRRLECQSRKVQARLDNLQRKYEFGVAHRGRENIAPKSSHPKASKQDAPQASDKASKAPLSSSTLKLLASLLDWVVDGQLVDTEEEKNVRELDQFGVPPLSLHERCSKVLPVLVEQIQKAEPFLQLPLLRLTYCTLTQLENSSQHPPLTSTLRRLGEEVSGCKSRVCPLFRESCLHTRFLSSLIILKTISQADIVAQALDVLHGDVGTDEGQAFFLKYHALAAILSLLRTGSPGLLSPAVDILLQMSSETRHQPVFLESCSTDYFFRCVSLLLRNPRLDLSLAEKLSLLLQKLSGIRKNRRLFEVSSLHLLLQEMHRTLDPARAFLSINLSSILFNLGMLTRP